MRWLIPQFIHHSYLDGQRSGRLEAASLFVDISGFSALTEALVKYQRNGAEALTTALNSVFQPLVTAIYAHSGFITTFAGDAFTALFPFEHDPVSSALKAVQVARYTQQFFTQHSRILSTRYGDFALSVKAGVGIGSVEWGILDVSAYPEEGIAQNTFFFRGTAVDACSQAEHYAARGEIIATQPIASLISQ